MHLTVQFDTNELTEADKALLRALAGDTAAAPASAPAAAAAEKPKAASKAKDAAPAAEPEATPAEEPAAADAGAPDEDRLKHATALAVGLMKEGKADEVKNALNAVGAAKVGVLTADQVEPFIALIEG